MKLLLAEDTRDLNRSVTVLFQMQGYDVDSAFDGEQALEFLKMHTTKCAVKSKTARRGEIEVNLEVRLTSENTDFINSLSEIDGVESAVLVSYNGDYMG